MTTRYFESVGLISPNPVDDWKKYNEGYPAFIKSKDGSSSILAYKVENEMELQSFAEQVPDYIIQPFIEGTEYTADIFCDFEGNPIFYNAENSFSSASGRGLENSNSARL